MFQSSFSLSYQVITAGIKLSRHQHLAPILLLEQYLVLHINASHAAVLAVMLLEQTPICTMIQQCCPPFLSSHPVILYCRRCHY